MGAVHHNGWPPARDGSGLVQSTLHPPSAIFCPPHPPPPLTQVEHPQAPQAGDGCGQALHVAPHHRQLLQRGQPGQHLQEEGGRVWVGAAGCSPVHYWQRLLLACTSSHARSSPARLPTHHHHPP